MSEDDKWIEFGEYTGKSCPNCSRERLMNCTDPTGVDRVICEKCHWEPKRNNYYFV